MLTTDERLAVARINGAGGVHAAIIGALHEYQRTQDATALYRIGRDADKLIMILRDSERVLKEQLEVARAVQQQRRTT